MKKIILTIALLVCIATPSFAHYLWIETPAEGNIGNPQDINVFYGEYTYGLIEKIAGEAFPKVKNFTLWVIDANGKKTQLNVTAKDDRYVSSFTPSTNGTYTIVLDNDDIEVIDYTKYDFGIFKTHYNSSAIVQVGKKVTNTSNINETGISIIEIANSTDEVKLQVLFKGKPLADNEADIFVADNWSKKVTTDKDGYVSFKRPWNTKYIIETTKQEDIPGKFKGKDYQFIWHCATYCIE